MVFAQSAPGPAADAAGVTFSLPDPSGRLDRVRLVQEVGRTDGLDFERDPGGWTLRLARPPVDRMEYLFEVVDNNGWRATILDPGNPLQVPGAFATKSVVHFPGYREPRWLSKPAIAAVTQPIAVDPHAHDITITGVMWAPAELDRGEPAPLLVVHDGPEYSVLGSFTQYLAALVGSGQLPRLRAALLGPGDRNSWYAANPAYAHALCTEVVPQLDRIAPATVRVGVGVSLGALSLLHAHRSYPAIFGGLFLQSGSFFTPQLDPQERGFARFGPLTAFVAEVEHATSDPCPVPVTITCGRPEENLANNRRMADTLTRLGYPVEFRELPDAHNYTSWRDALDPTLTELVGSVVGAHAA